MRPGLATIVVPAYNAEAYIGECLVSLLIQTYKNLEVLVVDDGSTDKTAEVVQAHAVSDGRVRLFQNANHGVSFSRNYAIARGEGEYLLFVDADDVVAPDYVRCLVEPLLRGECECSAVGMTLFSKDSPAYSAGEVLSFYGEEVFLACLEKCGGFLCNKGFLYSVVRKHDLVLDEGIAQSEDMLFLLNYLAFCKRLTFDTGIRYGYRQRRCSAANSHSNIKWFDAIAVYEAYKERLEGSKALSDAVRKAFLPVAYEARWRYRHCELDEEKLCTRISDMCVNCERGLSERPLGYRFKMFIYRHCMGLEMSRRKMVAR